MADSDGQALLLQVSADISGLERQMRRAGIVVDEQTGVITRRVNRMKHDVEGSLGSINVAGALGRVFDRSRLAVLEQGAARISVFGSALESLGPAGLAAGAGIAGLAVAFTQAREAAAFADAIGDTANRLHVTTDALQEYRYAVRLAGGEEHGADEALGAFSVTLGNAQAGLGRAVRAFTSLGFTTAQINGFHSTEEALEAVNRRINELGSNSQRDSIISRLGLDGMAPLINAGADAMDHFRAQARAAGIVMDADLIRRGGELNDQFETLNQAIAVQLHSAFVDLGPVLLQLLGYLAQMARFIADTVDGLRSVENRSTRGLEQQRAALIAQINQVQANNSGPAGDTIIRENLGHLQEIDAQLAARRATATAPPPPRGDRHLEPAAHPTHTPHAPAGPNPEDVRRRGLDAIAAADQELLNAQKAELQAQLAATDNVEEQGRLRGQITDIEHQLREVANQKVIDDLNSQVARHQISRADANTAIATRRQADAAQAQAETAERAQQDQATDFALTQQTFNSHAELLQLGIRLRDAQAQLSTSAQARADAAVQSFRDQQEIDANNYSEQQREARLRGEITQAVERERIAAFAAAQAAELAAQQDQQRRQANPLYDYGHPLQDVNTDLQSAAVNGLQAFNQGLTDAITGAKSLGDVFHDVALQIIADLIKIAIERNITEPLANMLFGGGGGSGSAGGGFNLLSAAASLFGGGTPAHNATGTDNWRGGLTWVGESGKELLNLPRGSQIIPGSRVSALGNAAHAAQQIIVQNYHLHAEGAVTTDELMAGFDRQMRVISAQNTAAGYRQARKDTPSWVAQRQRERRGL